MMTNQEIFDKVYLHLLTQKIKSDDPVGGSCLYRGQNGVSCAVGCLIADHAYHKDLEHQPSSSCIVSNSLASSGIVVDRELDLMLADLQVTHDHHADMPFTVKSLEYRMKEICRKYNLVYSVPQI